MNHDAIDAGINSIVKVEVPESWKNAEDEIKPIQDIDQTSLKI